MSEGRKFHQVVPADVKSGDLMAILHFVKVVRSRNKGTNLDVQDVYNGTSFEINGTGLVEKMLSADRHQEVIKVTATQAAEILVASPNRPFSVCFTKVDGDIRILRGRWLSEDKLMGRSNVEDLDQPAGKRFRQVCHREIKWLVVDGVRYEVKGR